MNIREAATNLFDQFGQDLLQSVGVGTVEGKDTIFLYAKKDNPKWDTLVETGWLGYPVVYRIIGEIVPLGDFPGAHPRTTTITKFPYLGAVVEINSFVHRQTPESEYSHFNGTDEELLALVYEGLTKGEVEPGYREGVILVSVNPSKFYTGLVELKDGDELTGNYKSRVEGETPRKTIRVVRPGQTKQPAQSVQIVLYAHDVLAEDGEDETDADYEVVSINAYPTLDKAPIDPMTLMHNHFQSDGGTKTNMTPEQFETQMRISFEYWKNKALLSSQNL